MGPPQVGKMFAAVDVVRAALPTNTVTFIHFVLTGEVTGKQEESNRLEPEYMPVTGFTVEMLYVALPGELRYSYVAKVLARRPVTLGAIEVLF